MFCPLEVYVPPKKRAIVKSRIIKEFAFLLSREKMANIKEDVGKENLYDTRKECYNTKEVKCYRN